MPLLRDPRTLARTLLLLTAFVWGATFTLVKASLSSCSPLLFNLLRFTLATLILGIVNRSSLRQLTRSHLQAGALAGLFLAAGYQFQTLGLARTTPAKSGFITGLVVVFVPALTLIPGLRPARAARPGVLTLLGAILAFAGLILITVPPGATFRTINFGDVLTVLCALAFAGHLLTLAHASPQVPAGVLATLQIAFCALFMLITLPIEPARIHLTPALILSLIICSALATAAAFTIQSFAQSVLAPTQTVLILTLEPVFAWLTSLLILHDVLSPRALLGAGLILTGILVIELTPVTHTTELPS